MDKKGPRKNGGLEKDLRRICQFQTTANWSSQTFSRRVKYRATKPFLPFV